MNGAHDLGGMHGMGPLVREENEPVFHHEWERRAFASTVAAGFLGVWNLDESRFARERMPPAEYLGSTYYEHWLWGLERLLVEKGLLAPAEIEARVAAMRGPSATASDPPGRRSPAPVVGPPAGAHPRLLRAAAVDGVLRAGGTARVHEEVPARFRAGQAVVTRNIHPLGHTRLPRYARGRRGVIARDHGVFIFADAHAMGLGRQPQHLYSVRFAASELWGEAACPGSAVHVDLWDDHLEPA